MRRTESPFNDQRCDERLVDVKELLCAFMAQFQRADYTSQSYKNTFHYFTSLQNTEIIGVCARVCVCARPRASKRD